MTVTQRSLRRVRERTARRADILAAARQVFALRGYTHATLDHIAARAAFAKGTIYNYFGSKELIFQQAIVSVLDEIHSEAAAALTGGAATRPALLRYATAVRQLFDRNRDFLLIVAREMNRLMFDRDADPGGLVRARVRRMHRTLSVFFGSRVASGELRAEDPDEIAFTFSEMIHMRAIRCAQGHCRPSTPEQDADFLVNLLLDGLAPAPRGSARRARTGVRR